MIKILIVEDEEPIANLIRMNLVKAGYQCETAFDGEAAADAISERTFDLILLDIMLPKLNGYEVLEYAKSVDIPVIFLTAMGETQQKVKGLRLGAEDYIAKPFEIAELLARVETVLRRCHKTQRKLHLLNIDIDTDSHTVVQDGHEVDLTTKEYELLLLFLRKYRTTISRMPAPHYALHRPQHSAYLHLPPNLHYACQIHPAYLRLRPHWLDTCCRHHNSLPGWKHWHRMVYGPNKAVVHIRQTQHYKIGQIHYIYCFFYFTSHSIIFPRSHPHKALKFG